jgi:LPPG:FO 2-phospho-L-lactate transferase
MITFLSGGTGTPKLLEGVRKIIKDLEISVIVNTGEDIWYLGGHISPDVDTVTYLFAGILNTQTWWGIAGDTTFTHEIVSKFLPEAFITVGDKDRAIQIIRGELLKRGRTLTEITTMICRHFNIFAGIFPMADTPWITHVRTPEGTMHFQEYWVKHRGRIPIQEVCHEPETSPPATDAALSALIAAEFVVIGPSNPVTSILPILSCKGVRETLKTKKVIAISPFIGEQPVSGPAGELMKTLGYKADSTGVYQLYQEYIEQLFFIQDIRDPIIVPGSIRLNTLMKSPEIASNIMKEILIHIRI